MFMEKNVTVYLQHYFNPDIHERRLKPTPGNKKMLHDLGYVQNVYAGQLLAEFLPISKVKEAEKRFVFSEPIFPLGINTELDAQNPHRLLASTKGYVTYEQGKICVKSSLKVHSDVSFHTGNILSLADVAIAGNVRAGFEVSGDNVLITGMVEGGIVHAHKSLSIQGGVRGGVSKHCQLAAQKDIRIAFAESVEIQCIGNLIMEKDCLHNTVYVGRNSLIKGRLLGGTLHGRQGVLVAGSVGNKAGTNTKIFLGYEPKYIYKLEKINKKLSKLSEVLRHLNAVAGHLPPNASETSQKLYKTRSRHQLLMGMRQILWSRLQLDEAHNKHCKVVVMGDVYPGVEIAIGQSYLRVEEVQKCVVFSLINDEIVCSPYTPAKK